MHITAIRLLLVIVMLSVVTLRAQTPPPPAEALDGVDTVLLLKTGTETFGKAAFKSEYGRFMYLFASAETKAEFDAGPERYAIQMNGACARMGSGTGSQSTYAVVDGKIYIFASDACQKAFVAAPARFIPKPAPPLPSDATAQAAGRALLDRAAQAHGGAKLDALTSYTESYVVATANPMPSPPRVTTTWRLPDTVRSERSFQMGQQSRTIVTLLADGSGWNGPADAPLSPMNPVSLPGLQQQMRRLVLPLLRTRNAPGTKVAALPPATVDGVRLDRVRMVRDGLDVTLNIDPASGRVHSTTAIDRGTDSAFGEVVVIFGDYRSVDGLLVPFSEKGLFEGQPETFLSRHLESAAVNPAVDPALFKAGGR
jgi:YHS domain-containing protein